MAATLNELLAQKAALEKQISEAQREERANAINQVKTLMAQYGLTMADISARGPAGRSKPPAKVAPKYRDPATGSTWSGRGLQPKWLRAALADGKKKISDFAL